MNKVTRLLTAAIKANKIDKPIMHYEQLDSGGIRLYLYGGEILEWKPEENAKESDQVITQDAKDVEPGAAKKSAGPAQGSADQERPANKAARKRPRTKGSTK